MQLLLLTYREELINAKVAKEHYEERLKSEVNFLKSQILGEQQAKESIEDQLTAEMEALREKVCLLESCRTELEAEQVLKHGGYTGGRGGNHLNLPPLTPCKFSKDFNRNAVNPKIEYPL
jgi:hypothetical protein